MKNYFVIILVLFSLGGVSACVSADKTPKNPLQIAFMADVHLQDIYGEFSDNAYKGVVNPKNGKHVLIRTMQSQLNSTRIFNENYFAFLAALDDVVKRGIKYVVLPGDFSDDGQPVNIRGLKKILKRYTDDFGLRFIATTGNHDPVKPFIMESGKTDFLGAGGKQQAIMSKEGMYVPKNKDELPVVITKDIRKSGYREIINELGDFGFFPMKSVVYWETPFSSYTYEDYNFKSALAQSTLETRMYKMPDLEVSVPDVSYLVEPEDGIWFLAIDANVYVPQKNIEENPDDPSLYSGASVGYKNVLTHKKHLLKWVKSVTERANKLGKKLIVFSHYPMIDFNDDASHHIKNLMGDGKMQLHRVPAESVSRLFAEAGVRVHFGGHMHINDTGVRKFKNNTGLVNIQIPSLAAYIPAYKIATLKKDNLMFIETIKIDSVPRFKELFALYEKEHAFLKQTGKATIWNKDILNAKTYHEFTNWHLKELVRLRFLKNDWPKEIKTFLLNATGNNLLHFANANELSDDLLDADYTQWTGFDMIFDFYRIRSADKLALEDISVQRIKQYKFIISSILESNNNQHKLSDQLISDMKEFVSIFHLFLNGEPADKFTIDMSQGFIIN